MPIFHALRRDRVYPQCIGAGGGKKRATLLWNWASEWRCALSLEDLLLMGVILLPLLHECT